MHTDGGRAGKSHSSNELAELVKTKIGLRRAFIDGSDDRLVDMALAEILDVELPDPSRPQLLVVDEFHMLKEHHKKDLLDWLHVNAPAPRTSDCKPQRCPR